MTISSHCEMFGITKILQLFPLKSSLPIWVISPLLFDNFLDSSEATEVLEFRPTEDWIKSTTDLVPVPLDEVSKEEDSSDLSELDSFKPISELLSMCGDLARRVQYILEIFGHDHNDVEQLSVKPKKGNSSINKVPGLTAGPSEGKKRRFGAPRPYRRN